MMRDALTGCCWVASTPCTQCWRHPCVVLAAQLVLRHIIHWAYLVRTRLPHTTFAAALRVLQWWPLSRWLRVLPSGGAGGPVGGGCPGQEPPLEVLERLGPWLAASDLASARLVCRAWSDAFGAQLTVAHLPPSTWQHAAAYGQFAQLQRLITAFPLVRTVACGYDRGTPVDARAMRCTLGVLARTTPTLCGFRLQGMVDPPNWPALAEGIAPLAPHLTCLDLSDVCWPDAASMDTLAVGLSGLQRLRIRSTVFSRLTARHLAAVAGMRRLRELSLGFRTAEGTSSCPLALDPLTHLMRLSALELEYTGLLELSSSAGFRQPAALSRLTALTSLAIRLVPMPDISALPHLPALRLLVLQQTSPLTPRQAAAVARCAGLARLELDPLPWDLAPCLGDLTSLRALSVQLHQPPRGGLPRGAAEALLALAPLRRLQAFALAGPLSLEERHIAALAAAWPHLRSLDLCCGLAAGTSGFAALSSLRRLRLSPFAWDVWSHEAPVLLHPSELPQGLTCLEARDVWVLPAGPDAGRLGTAPAADWSWSGVCAGLASSSSCVRRPSSSGASSSGSSEGAGDCSRSFGAWGRGPGSCGGGSQRTISTCKCGSAASVAGCICREEDTDAGRSSGLRGGLSPSPSFASFFGTEALAPPRPPHLAAPMSTAQRTAALTLPTPRLRRLALRCVGGAARGVDGGALPLPGLSQLTCLEELDLHHSGVTGRDLEVITAGPVARTLRALRLVGSDEAVRTWGGSLAKLTRLTALESLQIHAHERALNHRVCAAIATMGALRRLTLVTSPDSPSRFAQTLSVLTRLRHLAVLRVGLGFGALNALRRLHGCVARTLPGCQFEMLSDVDRLMEEEEAVTAAAGVDDDDDSVADEHEEDGPKGYGPLLLLPVGSKAGGSSCSSGSTGGGGLVTSASRVRGPRHVRLMRASWGG